MGYVTGYMALVSLLVSVSVRIGVQHTRSYWKRLVSQTA